MKIEELKQKDINLFHEFFRHSLATQFPEYSKKARRLFTENEWTKNNIRESLRRGERVYLLAQAKDEAVGYLIGSKPYAGVSFVYWIAVDEAHQRRGIGTKLLKKFISVSRREKAHKVSLDVTDKSNIPFYKKAGFERTGFIKKYYCGLDAWIMCRDVGRPKW